MFLLLPMTMPTLLLTQDCSDVALSTGGLGSDCSETLTSNSNSSSSSSTEGPPPCLADVATLAALVALHPHLLTGQVPGQLHAMGGALAIALTAAGRLAHVCGDRGALLVAQDLMVTLGGLLKGSGGLGKGAGEGGGPGCWLSRAVEEGEGLRVEQLLPQHAACAGGLVGGGVCGGGGDVCEGRRSLSPMGLGSWMKGGGYNTSSSSSSANDGGRGGGAYGKGQSSSSVPPSERGGGSGYDGSRLAAGAGELGEEEVLLLRVKELAAWSASEEYVGLMDAAPPLRRVVLPPAVRSSVAK